MAGVCFSCSATIAFVKLDTGHPIPIDPVPDDRGNVAAIRRSHTMTGFVVSKDKPWRPPFQLFMPHRATCKPEKPRVTFSQRTPALFDA